MRYLSFFALLAFLASCSSPKKSETKEEPDLKTQVMDIHDEVMPKMGELRATQQKLLALADSSVSDSVISVNYRALANDIKLANEAMMDWMRNFDPNYEGTEDEIEVYLNSKLEDMKKVRERMINSLEKGKKAMEE